MGGRFYGFALCLHNVSRRPAGASSVSPKGEPASPRGKLLYRIGRTPVESDRDIPEGSRNGTQAVPYGFAEGYIFEPAFSKNGHICHLNNCQLRRIVNCQLSIVNTNQELKTLKTMAAAILANTWNKSPAQERTKEPVWIWNLKSSQWKNDSIGCRRTLTAVE